MRLFLSVFKFGRLAAMLVAGVLLASCAAIKLSPAAQKVVISPNKAPKGCKFLGMVQGAQGNFFTGGFTSNKNLEAGAFNDMRNQAVVKGGNYVQLLVSRAGQSGGGGGSADGFGGGTSQTTTTNTGNVYKCPKHAIDE